MDKRVLVVEDDTAIASLLRDNLVYEGFTVETVGDGREALRRSAAFRPDLVLLDLTLPSLDGFEVCRALRTAESRSAIIILTVHDQKEDKVRGLELGADDYVTKPFALDELLARVHAVLRRTHPLVDRLVLGDTVVDFRRFRAERDHRDLEFTQREFDVLRYLAEHPNRVVTREELLRAVWGYAEATTTRTVDNFMSRLRRKIETDAHHPSYIHTVYGDGYRLTTNQDGEP